MSVAQLVEPWASIPKVAGSNPTAVKLFFSLPGVESTLRVAEKKLKQIKATQIHWGKNNLKIFKHFKNLSCILGKSIHNQRIERLWRDIFQGCTGVFYDLFCEMEGLGLLDPNNDTHLWCLHSIFLPLINNHLTSWKDAWIRHPLSSEKNKTPLQLWIQGLNAISMTNSTVAREVFQVGVNNLLCFPTMHVNYVLMISSLLH